MPKCTHFIYINIYTWNLGTYRSQLLGPCAQSYLLLTSFNAKTLTHSLQISVSYHHGPACIAFHCSRISFISFVTCYVLLQTSLLTTSTTLVSYCIRSIVLLIMMSKFLLVLLLGHWLFASASMYHKVHKYFSPMGGCYLTLQIATTGRTSYLGLVEPFPLFSLFFKRGERFYRLHAWLQQQANTLCCHPRYVVSTFLPLASMSDIHTHSVPPKTLGHKQMLPHSNTAVTCQAP